MFRLPPTLLFSLVLPIVVGACWLDVPNLQTTEGGYPPGMAGSAGEKTTTEPSQADTARASEADAVR